MLRPAVFLLPTLTHGFSGGASQLTALAAFHVKLAAASSVNWSLASRGGDAETRAVTRAGVPPMQKETAVLELDVDHVWANSFLQESRTILVYGGSLSVARHDVGFESVFSLSRTPALQLVIVVAASVTICAALGLCVVARLQKYETASLFFCFMGLSAAFSLYGVLQEYIMTQPYHGRLFPCSMFLICINRILTIVASGCAILASGMNAIPEGAKWTALPAILLMLGSNCQYLSLRHITFPVHVGFKSSIVLPTMVWNRVLNGQRNAWSDYIVALFITVCVVWFVLVTKSGNAESPEANTVLGIVLMAVYLFCESAGSTTEKRIFLAFPQFSHIHMMFAEGAFEFVFSLIVVLCTAGFSSVFIFIHRNPEVLMPIMFLACCSTAGQFFVFYTIRRHGPVAFAIMMTLKAIYSMFLSALLFKHELSAMGVVLSIAAFAALLLKPWIQHGLSAVKREVIA